MDLDAVGCSICLEILFEPITMPCNHRMCKNCFAKNLELTNMHCPFCKKRIGTWCRRAKNLDTLIDKKLWEEIQSRFASELESRGKINQNFLDFLNEIWTNFGQLFRRISDEFRTNFGLISVELQSIFR